MKKLFVFLMTAVLLCGCGSRETIEYVRDTMEELVLARPREVSVELPGEAALPTMEEGSRRYYLCEDYEITLETRQAGDLAATVEAISGHGPEEVTMVKTREEGASRYEFVWAAMGETGEQLGRAVILDDGNYHYTMSVLRDAENTEKLQVVWQQVFSSFHLA